MVVDDGFPELPLQGEGFLAEVFHPLTALAPVIDQGVVGRLDGGQPLVVFALDKQVGRFHFIDQAFQGWLVSFTIVQLVEGAVFFRLAARFIFIDLCVRHFSPFVLGVAQIGHA